MLKAKNTNAGLCMIRFFQRATSLFAVGGMLYCGAELLYRRRTHPSMFAAGGLALLAADRVRRLRCRGGAVVRVSLCTGAFTLIELCVGLICNRNEKARIWDYSRLPFNYKGQICLPFTLVWAALSGPAMGICALL